MSQVVPEHLQKTARGEEVTLLEAISEGLYEEMVSDDCVFLMGEDIGVYGGAFKVTRGFLEAFGDRRVIDTPIAEGGFTGAAAGAALLTADMIAGITMPLSRSMACPAPSCSAALLMVPSRPPLLGAAIGAASIGSAPRMG